MSDVQFDEAQQAFVDKLVGDARIKAREKAESDYKTQSAKALDATEKATLAAEAKWQELAQKHEARVKELEPFEAQAKAYGELVAGMLKGKLAGMSDIAKAAVKALPAMSSQEKLDWINKNEALLKSEAPTARVGTPTRKSAKLQEDLTGTPIQVSRYPIKL